MNLGSWTLPAQGRRVSAVTDERGPTVTWWQVGTIPHANQMSSTSQTSGHDKDMNFMMFQVMKHDFLDNDINVLCFKLCFFFFRKLIPHHA